MEESIISNQVTLMTPGAMLDNYNANDMVDALVSARARGVQFVIVDMSQLEFISSAGVGSMLGTVNAFREDGGDIVLCAVPPTILHVLKVLDLDTYFTIRSNRQEALALTEMQLAAR